jgi:hypothetical protein
MQERRKSGRSRALKDAKLFFGSSSMIDCVVRNFTTQKLYFCKMKMKFTYVYSNLDVPPMCEFSALSLSQTDGEVRTTR